MIDDPTDTSPTALSNSKNLLINEEPKKPLIFLKTNYSFVFTTLLRPESTASLSLEASVSLINQKEVNGATGSAALNKFQLKKNQTTL